MVISIPIQFQKKNRDFDLDLKNRYNLQHYTCAANLRFPRHCEHYQLDIIIVIAIELLCNGHQRGRME